MSIFPSTRSQQLAPSAVRYSRQLPESAGRGVPGSANRWPASTLALRGLVRVRPNPGGIAAPSPLAAQRQQPGVAAR